MAEPAVRVNVQITQFTNVDLSDDACARLDRLLSDRASALAARETYVEAAACMLYAAQLSALYVAPTAANGRAA